ncbi:MAG: hypothetical protein JWR11_2362 [Mycobacterium sp.]|nr:hypothetical protein [Mycobacterium sp.]MDT5178611.1 hypothetical protein [Mycobacterium sp.]
MKKFLRVSLATVAVAMVAVTPSVNAAPAGPASIDDTITQLQQGGYGVIVNRFGDLQREQCTIAAVRPGHTYSRTDSGAPGAGDDLVTTVMDKTVYVDLSC